MTPQELLALENCIGGPPWQNRHPNPWISGANTLNLQAWLTEKGMPSQKLYTLNREATEKCYCIKNYFDAVAGNRPKKPTKFNISETLKTQAPQSVTSSAQVRNLSNLVEEKVANTPEPLVDLRPETPDETKLLDRLYGMIDHKLQTIKHDLITTSVDTINSTINSAAEETKNSIIQSIEAGTLEVNLGKGLETKIINLVRNTTDEIVFQALRSRPKGVKSGDDENSKTQNSETPEEPFPEFPLPNSSFIPQIDPYFYFDPFGTRVARNALLTSRHVYASGPAGCGKTMLFEQICAVLGHGIFRVNPHDGITRGFFLGEMKLKGSETIFQYGALPIAMKEGLAFLIDEFSLLQPALTAVTHPVMERNGKLYIPETGEIITPAPGFVIFATDNTGGKGDTSGQFVGTEVQNTATLDRFSYKLQMDYMPVEKEHEMLGNRFPKQDFSEMVKLLRLAREIRLAFSRGELAITLSTRGLIDYFSHREQGFSQVESLGLKLLSWLDDDDKTLVTTMCQRLEIPVEEI